MPDTKLSRDDIQAMLDASPFINWLGVSVDSLDHDSQEITARIPMQPHLERMPGSGQFHGGAIASLIDIVGDFAVALSVAAPVPTINFRVDFLRPAFGDHLIATARARRVGRTIAAIDIDVLDPQDRLCAIGRGTYSATAG